MENQTQKLTIRMFKPNRYDEEAADTLAAQDLAKNHQLPVSKAFKAILS